MEEGVCSLEVLPRLEVTRAANRANAAGAASRAGSPPRGELRLSGGTLAHEPRAHPGAAQNSGPQSKRGARSAVL